MVGEWLDREDYKNAAPIVQICTLSGHWKGGLEGNGKMQQLGQSQTITMECRFLLYAHESFSGAAAIGEFLSRLHTVQSLRI